MPRPRVTKTSSGKNSVVFRKVTYNEVLESEACISVSSHLTEGTFEEKDDNGKPTGGKGKYWNSKITWDYNGNPGDFLLEGPKMKAQIYYQQKRKTYINKETGAKEVGGPKYSIRLRELEGEELSKYVEATEKIREGIIKSFIKQGHHIKTGKSYLKTVESYAGVFKPICHHPKNGDIEDTSKPKQEYLDAYDGTTFYLPPKSENEKATEMQEANYKDHLVEGNAIITFKPLIKYTTLFIGSQVMKAKKYLSSAVVYKIEKQQKINYQEDTPYDPNVDIEDDIMKSFKDMIIVKSTPSEQSNGKEDSSEETGDSEPSVQGTTLNLEGFED